MDCIILCSEIALRSFVLFWSSLILRSLSSRDVSNKKSFPLHRHHYYQIYAHFRSLCTTDSIIIHLLCISLNHGRRQDISIWYGNTVFPYHPIGMVWKAANSWSYMDWGWNASPQQLISTAESWELSLKINFKSAFLKQLLKSPKVPAFNVFIKKQATVKWVLPEHSVLFGKSRSMSFRN